MRHASLWRLVIALTLTGLALGGADAEQYWLPKPVRPQSAPLQFTSPTAPRAPRVPAASTVRPQSALPQFTSPAAPLVGAPWELLLAPQGHLINPLLLTDGTVIFQDNSNPSNWYKLSPDMFGSYVNGSWSQIASLPNGYGPTYFASAVLPDGRVIIMGGEYNGTPCCQDGLQVWTSLGAIYDPVADAWTSVSPPSGAGWTNTDPQGSCNGGIGDAPSIVLPNGTFLLGAACARVDALFNATNLGWTATGARASRRTRRASR
jgi:hypothetical protein